MKSLFTFTAILFAIFALSTVSLTATQADAVDGILDWNEGKTYTTTAAHDDGMKLSDDGFFVWKDTMDFGDDGVEVAEICDDSHYVCILPDMSDGDIRG
jgi:hypothetical protein